MPNPVGRPTKYTPAKVKEALSYLETFNSEYGHAIPSIIGMSMVLKLDDTTLYDWAKQEDNEFSRILPRCKKLQEFQLVQGGLKSELNSNIVKLALGKHGYSDKVDTTNTEKPYEGLDPDELDRLLREKMQKLKESEQD
jgi:hypothetical protein